MESPVKVFRTLLAVIDIVAAAYLLRVLAVAPWQRNVLKKQVESQTERLDKVSALSEAVVASAIRGNIAGLKGALENAPADVDLYMELAAQYRFLNEYGAAIATYREALRYDRRPELYRNIAECQMAINDYAGATESYAYAVAFAPEEMNTVPPFLGSAVASRARTVIAQIAASV